MRAAGGSPSRSTRFIALAVAVVLIGAVADRGGTPAQADDGPGTRIVDLPTRPGVTVRTLILVPPLQPVAAAILLAGSDGVVGISDRADADWTRGGSVLVRSGPLFAARGLYTMIVDPPSDHRRGLSLDFRAGAEHAEDIAAIIADARQRLPGAPVWLIAHSSASASAANVAARLPPPRGPDGVVLAATIWRPIRGGGPDGMSNAGRYRDIRVPVLLVQNRQDRCTPPALAHDLRALLTGAPRVELTLLGGIATPSMPRCGRFAAHGFAGIEEEFATAIAAWIARR
ncbi:MAG: alpha/beta hydrolase [Alphaproteobacteria bacterium]|nr:alpha/beta hydrolase [Alphaproteobacteria bacterium]